MGKAILYADNMACNNQAINWYCRRWLLNGFFNMERLSLTKNKKKGTY